jgi:glutamate decarboxylase
VSGHKYGLVYPGVGWVIWREAEDLPQELIFEVDYLGGSHANFGLNFSRGASQIVAQYYNLIRLGRQGYTDIMRSLADTAHWLATTLEQVSGVEVLAGGADLPVVCLRLADGLAFSVFDLSDRLRLRGWVVPAYRMAADAESVAVLRVVVREGLSRDMAGALAADLSDAVAYLTAHPPSPATPATPAAPATPATPAHTGGRAAARAPVAKSDPQTKAVC